MHPPQKHLTLLHSKQPKLYRVLAVLSAIGLIVCNIFHLLIHQLASSFCSFVKKTMKIQTIKTDMQSNIEDSDKTLLSGSVVFAIMKRTIVPIAW